MMHWPQWRVLLTLALAWLGFVEVVSLMPSHYFPCLIPNEYYTATQYEEGNCPPLHFLGLRFSQLILLKLADHNFVTAWSTVVIMIFTGVLGIFTVRLARSTRDGAEAAKKSAEVAEASLVEIERAFVSPKLNVGAVADRVRQVTVLWKVIPDWKNSGSTPAKQVFTHTSWDHFPNDLPKDFTFPDIFNGPQSENTMSFIGPKDEIVADELEIPVGVCAAAHMGWIKIYIWGWIEYDDVFRGSRPHRTEFCNEIIFDADPYAIPAEGPRHHSLRLKIYPKHTGADDGCYRQARSVGERHIPLV